MFKNDKSGAPQGEGVVRDDKKLELFPCVPLNENIGCLCEFSKPSVFSDPHRQIVPSASGNW